MTIHSKNSFSVLPQLASAVSGIALLSAPAFAATYFVRDGAPTGGSGLSWAAAFDSVQTALAAAAPGDEIRVGEGLYRPSGGRASSFAVTGVVLLGGFPAAGGPPSSRNPSLHITTLSGDIGLAGDVSDNCYHVVIASQCVIDGFAIESGNADGAGASGLGGGVYATGTLSLLACKISINRALAGGGVYYTTNQAGNQLTVDRCTFLMNDAFGNSAGGGGAGGGLLASSQEFVGRVAIDQSSFLGNSATAIGGGASIAMEHAATNTVFSGNDSVGPGGGLHAFAPSIALGVVSNCTFANNHSDYLLGAGGASLSHVQLVNSILWDNSAGGGVPPLLDQQLLISVSSVDFCDTEGAVFAPGTGNRSSTPLFISALGADGVAGTQDDNLHLFWMSPCLDVGDNARAAIPYDRDNQARIQASGFLGPVVVDLGAYERKFVWLPGVVRLPGAHAAASPMH